MTDREVSVTILALLVLACASPSTVRHYHVLPASPAESLRMAALGGYADLATLALKAGAKVNARDAGGLTSLMLAAHGQHDEVVKVLLASGADPNLRDADGHTALWYARGMEIDGRVPLTRHHFSLFVRLPRFMQTDVADVLESVTK